MVMAVELSSSITAHGDGQYFIVLSILSLYYIKSLMLSSLFFISVIFLLFLDIDRFHFLCYHGLTLPSLCLFTCTLWLLSKLCVCLINITVYDSVWTQWTANGAEWTVMHIKWRCVKIRIWHCLVQYHSAMSYYALLVPAPEQFQCFALLNLALILSSVFVIFSGILQHPDGTVLKQLQPPPRGPREMQFYSMVISVHSESHTMTCRRRHRNMKTCKPFLIVFSLYPVSP